MADYRGGDRRTTVYGQQAIQAIREGRTERQRKRNFNQKLIFNGVQAALQGARAGIGYANAKSEEADRQKEAFHEYANSPVQDYTPMKDGQKDAKLPGWLTGDPNYARTELGVDNDVTAAMNKVPPENPYDPDPIMEKAEAALAANGDEPVKAKSTWGADDADEEQRKNGRGMMRSQ